ncbi:unnamed protein product [Oikopleura dioica]|uniref:ADAM10 endopeptidase n=1 Tax=Oikopleura dioica TaxID=34765 RepID=E4YGF0_OIKDI|nr:unnamed protein product [Oikopleura dioica]
MRFAILFGLANVSSERLNKFIKSFEPLQYDTVKVEESHRIVRESHHQGRYRRSIVDSDGSPIVSLNFTAKGYHFSLLLHSDSSVFAEGYEVEDNKGHSLLHKIDHLVSGKLADQPGSHAEGQLRKGVFSGTIFSPLWGTFYVERRGEAGATHSVIYHENVIELPENFGSCKEMKHTPADFSAAMEAYHYNEPERVRRESDEVHEEDQRNTCIMRIQVDHMFSSEYRRCPEILAFISSHLKALNKIYIKHQFIVEGGKGKKVYLRPRFQVKRIKIDDTTGPEDRFRSRNIGVEKFLELASLDDYDDYCLSYVFTKRDFNSGVLGLAWVAQPEGSSGGICEKNKRYNDGKTKSLNTGIITIENYGSIVPTKVSHITFAHEIGHNFGSPHDGGILCTPGDSSDQSVKRDGNYIMFSRATSGDKENNDKFSECSVRNITRVLSKKRSCFVTSDAPICGNQIVDKEEECDCGFKEECERLKDNCCYPADFEISSKRCKLKRGAQCSISQGPCCDGNTCKHHDTNVRCAKEQDCTEPTMCSGKKAQCPTPKPKEDFKWCQKETMTCIGGFCSGSACDKFPGILESCSCPVPLVDATEAETKKHCHVCCQQKGDPSTCKSTGELSLYFNNRTIFRKPGSACDDFKGYCDVFSKCRKVDADGPLARLRNIFFNMKLYNNIRDWIVEYWWAVVAMSIALVMVAALFIKCCSIHTPTNNPKMRRHRDFPGTMTLRRMSGRHQNRGRQYGQNPSSRSPDLPLNSYSQGQSRR